MSTTLQVNTQINTQADTRSLDELQTALDAALQSLGKMAATDPGWEAKAREAGALQGRIGELRRRMKELADEQNNSAKSGVNFGQAMLQGSRGIQDFAAAGLNGIVNNLESMASAMGAGAGVAGAVTLLAVALQATWPAIEAWFAGLDKEGARMDEFKARVTGAAEAILKGYSGNKENAAKKSNELAESLQKQNAQLDAERTKLQAANELLKQRNAVQQQADERKRDADIADIEAQNLPKEQKADLIAQRKAQFEKANKDRKDAERRSDAETANADLEEQTKALEEATKQREALEKERDQTSKYGRLSQIAYGKYEGEGKDRKLVKDGQQQKVEAAVRELANVYASNNASPERVKKAEENLARQKAELERLKKEMADIVKNAPDGRLRGYEEVSGEAEAAKKREAELRKGLEADFEKEKERRKRAEVQAVGDENDYRRNMEEIERERRKNNPLGTGLPMVPGAPTMPLPGQMPEYLKPYMLPQGVMDPRNVVPPKGGAPGMPTQPALPNAPANEAMNKTTAAEVKTAGAEAAVAFNEATVAMADALHAMKEQAEQLLRTTRQIAESQRNQRVEPT